MSEWPESRDYIEALFDTGLCFADDDLIDGTVDLDAQGRPMAKIGNSASIFRLVKNDRAWAVKCFHWHTGDHQRRYKEIQKALEQIDSRYFVKFEYIKQGIKARGAWYPIVKMEWVEGDTLDVYILENLQYQGRVANVKKDFKELLRLLSKCGIAHQDLQHGNIMVHMDRIKLVDYDGFFVPSLADLPSLELGHYNYQHPRREITDFGPHLDNFAAWVIFASLHCLCIDPSLWQKLAGGDECLLFRQEDFGDTFTSYAFALLESHSSAEIRNTAKFLRSFSEMAGSAPQGLLLTIPSINDTLTTPIDLEPLPPISTPPAWIKAAEQSSKASRDSTLLGSTTHSANSGAVTGANSYAVTGADIGAHSSDNANSSATTCNNPTATASSGVSTTSDLSGTRRGFSYGHFREFNDAVKKPAASFEDAELINAFCILEDTVVGKNSRIYHFQGENREIALKCFTHHISEREEHYDAIKTALQGGLRPYCAQVYYLPRGIKINGQWCAALKMDWLKGQSISQLKTTPVSEAMASFLADRFAELMKVMRAGGYAHGDLTLDNLMLVDNDLKIVDYDAMYVPRLTLGQAIESGSPGYQHPQRSLRHFGPYIDNFSAWLIYYMLKKLATKPKLEIALANCLDDERQNAVVKAALRNLENDRDVELREMGALLKLLLTHPANATPYLDAELGFEKALKPQAQQAKEGKSNSSPFLKKKPTK